MAAATWVNTKVLIKKPYKNEHIRQQLWALVQGIRVGLPALTQRLTIISNGSSSSSPALSSQVFRTWYYFYSTKITRALKTYPAESAMFLKILTTGRNPVFGLLPSPVLPYQDDLSSGKIMAHSLWVSKEMQKRVNKTPRQFIWLREKTVSEYRFWISDFMIPTPFNHFPPCSSDWGAVYLQGKGLL